MTYRSAMVRLKIAEVFPVGRVARVVAVSHPGTFTGIVVTE
jgi:hypothetical protein